MTPGRDVRGLEAIRARRRALVDRAALERGATAAAWSALAGPLAAGDRILRGARYVRSHPVLGLVGGAALALVARRARRGLARHWWLPTVASVAARMILAGLRGRR